MKIIPYLAKFPIAKLGAAIFISTLSVACLADARAQRRTPPTLCHPNENVFFSCEIGKKIVSLCTSSTPPSSSYMEYRFGTPSKIEMTFKGGQTAPQFTRVEIVYANNSNKVIWFHHLDTDYLINSPMRGAPGLEVKKDGETIAEMTCKNAGGGIDDKSPFITEKPMASPDEAEKYWRH